MTMRQKFVLEHQAILFNINWKLEKCIDEIGKKVRSLIRQSAYYQKQTSNNFQMVLINLWYISIDVRITDARVIIAVDDT